jgi:hypothetical protein
MKIKIIIISIVALLISACVNQVQPHQMATPFSEKDFARYAKKGTSSITGQAFLKTRGGEVRFGAGETVTLIPVTAYSNELWNASLIGARVAYVDPEYAKYTKNTVTDGAGNFEFKDLPAGEYYIECSIFWEVPTDIYPYMRTTGSAIKKHIKVADGENLKVMLTE